MIQEPWFVPSKTGSIEVICGGMFSGKTEELLRRAKRSLIAGQRVVLVKPVQDDRYSSNKVVSHDRREMVSHAVGTASEIPPLGLEADVVCIDEAQFFENDLIDVANTLANSGKRVIIAGLDMDYEGRPFEPIPQLLAIAEFITKLHAICAESGSMAHYSQRVVEDRNRILVGESDAYEPRARHCFRPPVDRGRSLTSKGEAAHVTHESVSSQTPSARVSGQ